MREWLEAFLLICAWAGMVGFVFNAVAFLFDQEPRQANLALAALAAWLLCGIAAIRVKRAQARSVR